MLKSRIAGARCFPGSPQCKLCYCVQTRLPADSSVQLMGAESFMTWTSFLGTLCQDTGSEDTTSDECYEKLSANDLPEIL